MREFSDLPVPRALIETLVASAATAPSGANKQPWRFVCIDDPVIKHEIRLAAEEEEREVSPAPEVAVGTCTWRHFTRQALGTIFIVRTLADMRIGNDQPFHVVMVTHTAKAVSR